MAGKFGKVSMIAALVAVIGILVTEKLGNAEGPAVATTSPTATSRASLPQMMDFGSETCIPCKMMAPILEEMEKEFAGRLDVTFVDVMLRENKALATQYRIELIPTQVFLDAQGKELWRHQGFISKEDMLAKWKELGHDFNAATAAVFERLEPAKADTRAKETVCYLCDGDIDSRTGVMVKTAKGDVRLCSPHCYFILYSCLTEDKAGFEKKVSVTDYTTGKPLPAAEALYLYGTDEKTARPWVKAFADKAAAEKEQQSAGGSIVSFVVLQDKELAARCGFCDRACYPEDAAAVTVEGIRTWGCCSHCALGVAARTGKDIEVRQKDALTGEMIVVKTLDGSVASLEPATAVAWFGQSKAADGKWVSAGCFHQGFFVNADNLKKWVEQHPYETGRQISIQQALADKMKLSPQQIQKACKIGECAPK